MLRIFAFLFLISFLSACAGSNHRLPQVSNEDVTIMQQKIAERRGPLEHYDRSDKQYKQMIAGITKRLTKAARPLCELENYIHCYFDVVYDSDDEVNAYASEGYKITLYRGLLRHLKNEDEIAAVVAHEMGHHLAHHNDEQMQNAAAGAVVSGVLAAVLVAGSANNGYYSQYQQQQNAQAIQDIMQVGAEIGALSYSKEQEREADLLGAYLLSHAGYNLKRAQNMLFTLTNLPGETNRAGRASILDTHPANPERLVAWEMAIEEIRTNKTRLPYANLPPEKIVIVEEKK